MVSVDAHEVFALAAGLERLGAEVGGIIMTEGITQVTKKMEETWRSNATGTAGRHGIHYPASITSEVHGDEGEVGPDSGMPQGGMSFEEGSRNQPPHLDGQKAAEVVGPWGAELIDRVISAAIP
jgi:hypothetical protein